MADAVNTATPTDVSSVNTPMPKAGNMQTGEYTSPYQQQQQELVDQLGKSKLYETPQETKDYLNGLFASQADKYNYSAENDPLVAQARANVEQTINNMVAKRGFKNSSGIQDMINQQMAKVQPQFEQIARGEHADFLDRQLNMANTMMQWEKIQFDRSKDQIQLITTKLDTFNKMDDREFNLFKAMLEQRRANLELYLLSKQYELDKKVKDQSMAMSRVENLGYVDEKASLILGVPVGAKAKWAQQLAIEQQNKLETIAKENEYNMAKQKLDADLEKELYALKSQLDLDSQMKLQAQTYQYKIELAKLQASLARKSSGGSSKKSSGGGVKAATGITISTTKTDKELQKEFEKADKIMHQWVVAGLSSDGLRGAAADLYKEGYSEEVVVAIKQKYVL